MSELSEARADLSERAPTTAPDRGSRYDAFVSYSHAADGQLAPSLRNGLQRFATPWRVFRWRNPVRALRIFQDQASLSANPALWPTIEHGLGSAEWFILLASPQSAQSPWVEKEVDFWCRNKRPERLLIVQTDGDIAWDHDKNDFDWTKTTALPRRLSTVFTDEPRWIDARWARTGAHATLRDPRFRDLVAELAAPLRGIAKDELIGEDIRQHRRLNGWRNAALGVVTMLLIGAVAAAAVAVKQRDQAQRNQLRAVASLANIEAELGSPATAIRAALAALPASLDGTGPLNTAWSALYQSLGKIQELRRFIGHEKRVPTAAFGPDGRTLVTGSDDKTARLWEGATGKDIATLRGHEGTVKSAAFSPDGRTLVTGSVDKAARLWEVATGKEIAVLRGHEGAVWSVAFSPDGGTVVTGGGEGNVILWELSAGKGTLMFWLDSVASVAFSPDGRTLVTSSWQTKEARLWDVATRKEIATFSGHGPSDVHCLQPRRPHPRHRLVGSHRTAVAGGYRQGNQCAPRSRGCCLVRSLQLRLAEPS
jgi:WD40 repeat protein